MGYTVHNVIVVTGREPYLSEAHRRAVECVNAQFSTQPSGIPTDEQGRSFMVTDTLTCGVNGNGSFMLAPDGSKEGWDASARGDLVRQALRMYLEAQDRLDWVEVEFGGDLEGPASVVQDGYGDEDDENG